MSRRDGTKRGSARSASGDRRMIRVGALARVEGEGGLQVRIRGDEVQAVRLKIFEPPRMFEAFLRGRKFTEAPDITARICGICPWAYQMSASLAMEAACGVTVEGTLRELRRLVYCGEWLESHALHVTMLHAPDFLGYESAIEMAKTHPDEVRRGLRLKKLGNDLMDLVAGRSVHPVNVRVGGFYRTPDERELGDFAGRLERGLADACEMVRWVSAFEFPDLEQDCEFVSLAYPGEYPMIGDRIVSSAGLDISVNDWEDHFEEYQVRHSTALHARRRDAGSYLVGPLARYNLCRDRLTPQALESAAEAGLGLECRNPFRSILVRGVELVYACEEALRIIRSYLPPPAPAVAVTPRAGRGSGVSEAPRGLLYHRYDIDDAGTILDAKIAAPTSQNQPTIESDLRRFVEKNLSLPDDRLTWLCEQVVRNYDPCISCSAHFLRTEIERD